MSELLSVLTLVAAVVAAVAVVVMLGRDRASSREAREEMSRGLSSFGQNISTQMTSIATVQNNQIDSFALQLENFRRTLDESLGRVQDQQRLAARETRETLEQRLEKLQQDNSAKLEQMRQTVDEKLHVTREEVSGSLKSTNEVLSKTLEGMGKTCSNKSRSRCRRRLP